MRFRSDLVIRSGKQQVNGKSILELMTLNAALGTELELRARGADAEQLVKALEALFAERFGETEGP